MTAHGTTSLLSLPEDSVAEDTRRRDERAPAQDSLRAGHIACFPSALPSRPSANCSQHTAPRKFHTRLSAWSCSIGREGLPLGLAPRPVHAVGRVARGRMQVCPLARAWDGKSWSTLHGSSQTQRNGLRQEAATETRRSLSPALGRARGLPCGSGTESLHPISRPPPGCPALQDEGGPLDTLSPELETRKSVCSRGLAASD
jgi:hypothetical protein